MRRLLADGLRELVDAGDVTLEDAVHMMLPPPLQALQECGELPMVRPWPLRARGRRVVRGGRVKRPLFGRDGGQQWAAGG